MRASSPESMCRPIPLLGEDELEEANLRELARLRHELAIVTASPKNPFGSVEFMQRYVGDLKRRIAALEQELPQ